MKKKNVVLIAVDECRTDSLGYMGHSIVKTPNIDKLAQEGMVFTNAHCASPLCVPSRVAMFTGQFVGRNGSVFNYDQDHIGIEKHSFIIEALKKNGYTIGLAGKNHTFQDEYFEKWFDYREEYSHWGKLHGEITESDKEVIKWRHNDKRFKASINSFEEEVVEEGAILQEGLINEPEPFDEQECVTYRIAQDGIIFIEQNKEKPFFLYYSFPDPHWPNVVCEPYYSMYNPEDLPDLEAMEIDWSTHPFKCYVQSQENGFDKYTDLERKKILAIYYGMITFIDKAVGMLIDKIEALGLKEDTVIVFCADHGNFAGRYGLIGKTGCFPDALVRIPLVINIPGIDNKKSTEAQVSNIDIFPTLLDYLNIEIDECVQGVSFLEVMKGTKEEHRTEIFAEVNKPDLPPPVMELDKYQTYREKRLEEDGWHWFIDYTCNGRAAMVKADGWKYCYYVNDRDELYHLNEDPYELNNLASDPNYRDKKEYLRNRLFNWVMTVPFWKGKLLALQE